MKRIILSITVVICTLNIAQAQQDALFSQYMFNTMLINPAYTGSRDVVSLNALYRKQWLNVKGAPETMTFSADMPLRGETMGGGLVVYNDRIGVVNNTGFYANYAYRVRLNSNLLLSMGASAGAMNYRANYTEVKLSESGGTEDPAFAQNVNRILPNLGLGLYLNNDRFYIGLSIPHVLNNKLTYAGFGGQQAFARQYRHIFLIAGYVFDLNHYMKLKPSTLIKQVYGAPIQMDLNANLWFHDRIAVGLSYRSLDAPVFLLEVQILDQLRFGYAFDYSHTRVRYYNMGTHEVMLRYELGYDKGKMITPRYF